MNGIDKTVWERLEALESQLDINKKQYLSETNELGNIITKLTQRMEKIKKSLEQMATIKNVEVCHDDIEALEQSVKRLEEHHYGEGVYGR